MELFFKIDEEKMHDEMIRLGKILGSNIFTRKLTSLCLNFSDPMLTQNIRGIIFKNPVVKKGNYGISSKTDNRPCKLAVKK